MEKNISMVWNGWKITIEKIGGRRSLSLRLVPPEGLFLKIPLKTPMAEVLKFLEMQKPWIAKHFSKWRSLDYLHPKQFLLQKKVLLLGELTPWVEAPTLVQNDFWSFAGGQLIYYVPLNLWRQKNRGKAHESLSQGTDLNFDLDNWKTGEWWSSLKKFYTFEGRRCLELALNKWITLTGLHPRKISFRSPKTRWGSCSSEGHISLNWKLIVLDSSLLEYVVLHELCHLKHLNHSEEFWGLMAQHMPDFALRRQLLKKKSCEVYFLDL